MPYFPTVTVFPVKIQVRTDRKIKEPVWVGKKLKHRRKPYINIFLNLYVTK